MGLLPAKKGVVPPQRARHKRHAPPAGAAAVLDVSLAGLERRLSALTLETRMQAALILSILLHTAVLYGVSFKMPDPSKLANLNQPLEVVLVNTKTVAKPPKADALAQHNLDGGGNTDAERRAKSPLPVTRNDKQANELSQAAKRVKQLEQEARQLMTRAKSGTQVESAPTQPEPQPEAQPTPNAADLMQRSLEIARLEAQISKDWDAYQKRPRRRFVGRAPRNSASRAISRIGGSRSSASANSITRRRRATSSSTAAWWSRCRSRPTACWRKSRSIVPRGRRYSTMRRCASSILPRRLRRSRPISPRTPTY